MVWVVGQHAQSCARRLAVKGRWENLECDKKSPSPGGLESVVLPGRCLPVVECWAEPLPTHHPLCLWSICPSSISEYPRLVARAQVWKWASADVECVLGRPGLAQALDQAPWMQGCI